MADIQVNIPKISVFNDVAQQTAYIGQTRTDKNGMPMYEQIAVFKSDFPMIERFWRDGIGFLASKLKRKIVSISPQQPIPGNNTNEVIVISFSIGENFDSSYRETIKSSVFSYFVNYVTAKWLLIKLPDEAAKYDTYATQNLNDVIEKVFFKKAPKRP